MDELKPFLHQMDSMWDKANLFLDHYELARNEMWNKVREMHPEMIIDVKYCINTENKTIIEMGQQPVKPRLQTPSQPESQISPELPLENE